MWDEPVPGIPGKFSEITWIDSVEYGGDDEERRVDDSLLDLNPAPLAQFIATGLKLVPGSRDEAGQAIANDDLDGPIHIVHMLVAVERSAQLIGGGLPRPGRAATTQAARTIIAASGHIVPAMVTALYEGGPPAATALVRGWDPGTRKLALDALWTCWVLPIAALCEDIPSAVFRRQR